MPKGNIEYSEQQLEQIKVLQQQIKEIKNVGKYDKFYTDIRTMTVVIKKDKSINDLQKKKALLEYLKTQVEELEQVV